MYCSVSVYHDHIVTRYYYLCKTPWYCNLFNMVITGLELCFAGRGSGVVKKSLCLGHCIPWLLFSTEYTFSMVTAAKCPTIGASVPRVLFVGWGLQNLELMASCPLTHRNFPSSCPCPSTRKIFYRTLQPLRGGGYRKLCCFSMCVNVFCELWVI